MQLQLQRAGSTGSTGAQGVLYRYFTGLRTPSRARTRKSNLLEKHMSHTNSTHATNATSKHGIHLAGVQHTELNGADSFGL